MFYITLEISTKSLGLGHSYFKKKISQPHQELPSTDFIKIDQIPGKIDLQTSHQLDNNFREALLRA